MDDVIVAFINRADWWAVDAVFIMVAVLLGMWIWSNYKVLRQSSSVQVRATQLIETKEELAGLKHEFAVIEAKYKQSQLALDSLKDLYEETKYIFASMIYGHDIHEEVMLLMKTLIDKLSTDLKSHSGKYARCAIWEPDEQQQNLRMLIASAGFTDYYRNKRTLPMDRSIAGHCFRSKRPDNIPDVSKEKDFLRIEPEPCTYNSLLSIPVCFWHECFGVITVDCKEIGAFTNDDIQIVKAYAEIVSLLAFVIITNSQWKEARKESAVYAEDEGA